MNFMIQILYMNGGVTMRTEPLVVKDFKYVYLDVDVCLSFPDNLTFITGESATGKTFLYDIFYL